ncbi:SHOCT domain-containing protein [Streptomyces caatingaensis]|uniref:SHOCT domain-containing protein n=1 Tax=Streptomyces caatingaensis TaxID=1678637 RepID=A0A0K9XCG1_9ACTN|nr:SHOCT domain-containing protein [Streptomyces caatingaensis]KNB50796.1 hypothetical protein AC230_20360 [Streptomyces caatingaensis]
MTFWYGDHGGGWGWVAMSIGMVLFWAVVVAALVLLARSLGRPHQHTRWGPPPTAPAEQVLAERFARGEIDEEEYRRRLEVLRSTGAPPPR